MSRQTIRLAAALAALFLAAGAAASDAAMTPAPGAAPAPPPPAAETEAVATLRAAGFADVRDVEYEDGLWEAEVRRADGLWAEVAVDPSTGEVFDARSPKPLLDLPAVLAAIEHAGYRQVHDVERDGALWEADALDADGRRAELRISGYDGRIVSARQDGND